VAFDREGKRGGEERSDRYREPWRRHLPRPRSAPQVGQGRESSAPRRHGGYYARGPASARSPSRTRQSRVQTDWGRNKTVAHPAEPKAQPARSPTRRRTPPKPPHRSRSQGGEPKLRPWRMSRPHGHLLRARDLVTLATSNRSRRRHGSRRGLSRAHFSREFRRALRRSPPHAYLLTRRLERAAALLRTTRTTRGPRSASRSACRDRLLHDQLQPHLWEVADGLPHLLPPRLRLRSPSGLLVRAYGSTSKPHVSRRQRQASA